MEPVRLGVAAMDRKVRRESAEWHTLTQTGAVQADAKHPEPAALHGQV